MKRLMAYEFILTSGFLMMTIELILIDHKRT